MRRIDYNEAQGRKQDSGGIEMKLIGVSLATGTNALVTAMNYERPGRLPHVRLNSGINDIGDVDNVLILGANKENKRDFHILAQIHGENVRPIENSRHSRQFTTRQASLKEETGVSPFSAYLEEMPHVD